MHGLALLDHCRVLLSGNPRSQPLLDPPTSNVDLAGNANQMKAQQLAYVSGAPICLPRSN